MDVQCNVNGPCQTPQLKVQGASSDVKLEFVRKVRGFLCLVRVLWFEQCASSSRSRFCFYTESEEIALMWKITGNARFWPEMADGAGRGNHFLLSFLSPVSNEKGSRHAQSKAQNQPEVVFKHTSLLWMARTRRGNNCALNFKSNHSVLHYNLRLPSTLKWKPELNLWH